MTTIANLLGSVMTAVRLPRKRNENLYPIEKYVQAEFQKRFRTAGVALGG